MIKSPCAWLFCNGNAAFFDENDNQIVEFQKHGWKGLHLFMEKYPEASVSMTNRDQIPSDMIPYLLENIIDPRKKKK